VQLTAPAKPAAWPLINAGAHATISLPPMPGHDPSIMLACSGQEATISGLCRALHKDKNFGVECKSANAFECRFCKARMYKSRNAATSRPSPPAGCIECSSL
jgi:hypothetical protein